MKMKIQIGSLALVITHLLANTHALQSAIDPAPEKLATRALFAAYANSVEEDGSPAVLPARRLPTAPRKASRRASVVTIEQLQAEQAPGATAGHGEHLNEEKDHQKGRLVRREERFTRAQNMYLRKLAKLDWQGWPERAASFNTRFNTDLSANQLREQSEKLENRNKLERKPKKLKYWTLEEENRLIQALSEGMTIKEMAKLLERSPGAVQTRLGGLERQGRIDPDPRNTTPLPYTIDELEFMEEKRAEGKTWNEIIRDHFPDRSSAYISRRYNRYIRDKERKEIRRQEREEREKRRQERERYEK